MPSPSPPPSPVHTPPLIDRTSDPLADISTVPTSHRATGPVDTSPARRRSTAENILSAIAPPTFTDPLRPQRNFANLVGLVASGISNGVRSGVQAHRDFNTSRQLAEQEHQAAEQEDGVEGSKDVKKKKTLEADENGSSERDRDHSGGMRRDRGSTIKEEGNGKSKSTVYDLVMRAESLLRGDPQMKLSSASGFGMSVLRHASTSTSRDGTSASQSTSVSVAKEAEAFAETSQMPQEDAPPEYDAPLPSYLEVRLASRHRVVPAKSGPARPIDPPPAPVEGSFLPERYTPSPPPALPGYLPIDTNYTIPSIPATTTAPAPAERESEPTFPVVPTHDIRLPRSEGTTQPEEDLLDGSAQSQVTNDAHRAVEPAT